MQMIFFIMLGVVFVAVFLLTLFFSMPAFQKNVPASSLEKLSFFDIKGKKRQPNPTFIERIVLPVFRKFLSIFRKFLPRNLVESVSKRLELAGIQDNVKVDVFLGIKFFMPFVFLLVLFFISIFFNVSTTLKMILLLLVPVSYIFPDYYLKRKTTKRQEEIRKSLCDIHLEAIRDSLVAKRIEVEAPHPVNTFMREHVIILDNLKKLGELVARLKAADTREGLEEDLEKLEEVAGELVEAEKHHQREEEALFPALEKHDIVEPPQIMVMDHVEFRKRKQELYQLARQRHQHDFTGFKAKAIELGEYLTRELESHIFKEDNILYQIALQVLTPEEWDKVKRLCDELGYCCFTPQDRVKEPEKAAREK